jgi:ubiquinone/menaquinone biosynthesis C-methylase UbiE
MHFCARSFPRVLAVFRGKLAALGFTAALLGACAHEAAAPSASGGHSMRFDDPEAWAKSFEDPKRDAWQRPEAVVAALGLPPEALLADIGSATGYFSVRLAKALPKGWVYGVDIESAMVDFLRKRVLREHVPNLTAVLGSAEDPKLPKPVDVVLVVNTYHHIENRPAYFQALKASLKPGGRVAIIEFRKDSSLGPPTEMRLTAEQVAAEMQQAGYRAPVSHDFLREQMFLVFSQ